MVWGSSGRLEGCTGAMQWERRSCPGLDFTPHALAGNAIWGLIWNEAPAVIPRHVTHPPGEPRNPAMAASARAELAGGFGMRRATRPRGRLLAESIGCVSEV